MSASMMKNSTRQAASARPSTSSKRSMVPYAVMHSAPRVSKASPAPARPSTACSASVTEAVAVVSREYDLKWR